MGALEVDLQGKHARQAEELEKFAQGLGERWSQQFQQQAEAAVETLRLEAKNLGRVVEESKLQLDSLAEAKLASVSQAAANATAGLEEEQKRFKNQYETSPREREDLLELRRVKQSLPSLERGTAPKRRVIVAQLALMAGLFLLITASLLGVYLWKPPVMQLQPEAPAEFIEQNPDWSAKRRAREEEVAQAYWHVAVASLQQRYPFGRELPADPPSEFQVDKQYAPAGGAKAFSETRARCWEKLRHIWVQPQSWVVRDDGNTRWTARLWQVWDHLHLRI